MKDELYIFIEEVKDKNKLKARGKPLKFRHSINIFIGLGDRRKDPARRSGRVITITAAKEVAVANDPSASRMRSKDDKKKELQRIKAIRKWAREMGFKRYRR